MQLVYGMDHIYAIGSLCFLLLATTFHAIPGFMEQNHALGLWQFL